MPGRIREAHGGVLFLDVITDMPLALQARLHRIAGFEVRMLPLRERPDRGTLNEQLLAECGGQPKTCPGRGRTRPIDGVFLAR